MEMDGQIIGAETSSLVMKLNGMIQMAMDMEIIGIILSGILLEIQIGLANLFLMLSFQISVRIHQPQTLMKTVVPRVREILMGMV
jgi:hypothetical protein